MNYAPSFTTTGPRGQATVIAIQDGFLVSLHDWDFCLVESEVFSDEELAREHAYRLAGNA